MARTGQTPTHAPQPVQRAASSSGRAAPPSRGLNRIAVSPQASPQLRQTTSCCARQLAPMRALSCQGGCHARVSASRRNARGRQAVRQSPQKVHTPVPWRKSMVGKPPVPRLTIRLGQAPMQASQRVQACSKSACGNAQGGCNSTTGRENFPLRKERRDNAAVSAIMIALEPMRVIMLPCSMTVIDTGQALRLFTQRTSPGLRSTPA